MRIVPVSASIAVAFFSAFSPAVADPAGIAFDQAQRVYLEAAPPALPESYDDFVKTFNLLGPSLSFPPLPGLIAPGPGAQGLMNAVARQKDGVVFRYRFLGDLVRVDDVLSQRATIGRPDRGEVDELDLATKTYVVIRGAEAQAMLHPSITRQMRSFVRAIAPQQTAQGSLQFTAHAAKKLLAPRTYEGIAATGVRLSLSLKATTLAGHCAAVDITTVGTNYVDASRRERITSSDADASPNTLIRRMQAGQACAVRLVGTIPSRDPLLTHFLLVSRTDVSIAVPHMPGPFTVTTVIARGHIAPVTSADAGIFEIPADFVPAPAAPPAAGSPAPSPSLTPVLEASAPPAGTAPASPAAAATETPAPAPSATPTK